MKFIKTCALLCSVLFILPVAAVQSAPWPEKPIHLIIPYPAGGSTDALGRIIANRLEAELKQTVVVENVGGANGSIGAKKVALAPADGYTVFLANMGILTINPHIYANQGFNPRSDFKAVRLVASVVNLLAVRADLPAKNVKELIALGKSEQLTYASAGTGSSQHLAGALFARMTDTQLQHVPYRGGSPAMVDLVAGRVDMMFGNYPELISMVQSGKLRALGFGNKSTTPPLAGVPAIADEVSGFEITNWYGLLVPKATNPDVVEKLGHAIDVATADQSVRERLKKMEIEVTPATSKEFQALIDSDFDRWSKVIAESGIKSE